MSLYLGKIHYWLFNKIVWFKDLEIEFVNLAKEKGLNTEEILNEITKNYGERVQDKPLEEMIDTSNIHGWLDNKIKVSENRLAEVISFLKLNSVSDEELKEVFKNQGRKAAIEDTKKRSLDTAEEIFNGINDYVLDGMPCDRVNEVIESLENKVIWRRNVCVHKEMWSKENLDSDYFYEIRDEFIKAFVTIVNPTFIYKRISDNEMTIEKVN